RDRLRAQAASMALHAERTVGSMKKFLGEPTNASAAERLGIAERIISMQSTLAHYSSDEAADELSGTLGRQVNWR
ncbi:MAG TPA: hypothetical protein PKY27_08195, partial [Arachnia sp.]|nr:hypothetical protein [Arachnia sp.]